MIVKRKNSLYFADKIRSMFVNAWIISVTIYVFGVYMYTYDVL